jgi:hypothetical protein
MFIMKPVLDKFGIRLDRAFSCEDAFFCFEKMISLSFGCFCSISKFIYFKTLQKEIYLACRNK